VCSVALSTALLCCFPLLHYLIHYVHIQIWNEENLHATQQLLLHSDKLFASELHIVLQNFRFCKMLEDRRGIVLAVFIKL
jgi:hypothetical protein